MSEPIVQAPVKVEAQVQPEAKLTAADIVNKFQPEEVKPDLQIEDQPVSLDDIKDPVARKVVEEKIKNLEKGYNKKFMLASDAIKQAETLKTELQKQTDWSPERINQLTQDPKFVQAAQTALNLRAPQEWEGSQEDWSQLNASEKRDWAQLKSQVHGLLANQNQMQKTQIDSELKTRFKDYDPTQVDGTWRDIVEGRWTEKQIREALYKASNYERHVEQTYNLGLKDRNQTIQEKMNGATTIGLNTSLQEDTPTMKENERPKDFFLRLANWRSSQMKGARK